MDVQIDTSSIYNYFNTLNNYAKIAWLAIGIGTILVIVGLFL